MVAEPGSMASSSGAGIPVEPPPGIQPESTPPVIGTGMPPSFQNPIGFPTEMGPSMGPTPMGSRNASPDGQQRSGSGRSRLKRTNGDTATGARDGGDGDEEEEPTECDVG